MNKNQNTSMFVNTPPPPRFLVSFLTFGYITYAAIAARGKTPLVPENFQFCGNRPGDKDAADNTAEYIGIGLSGEIRTDFNRTKNITCTRRTGMGVSKFKGLAKTALGVFALMLLF
ncbi:MAG: hypothetical protein LBE10_08885, partial [Treponema sp.]|nr:hypothetical protein [Treponema sp.]